MAKVEVHIAPKSDMSDDQPIQFRIIRHWCDGDILYIVERREGTKPWAATSDPFDSIDDAEQHILRRIEMIKRPKDPRLSKVWVARR